MITFLYCIGFWISLQKYFYNLPVVKEDLLRLPSGKIKWFILNSNSNLIFEEATAWKKTVLEGLGVDEVGEALSGALKYINKIIILLLLNSSYKRNYFS